MANNQCDRLIDYFNGDLNELEKKAFEKHLHECADCEEELQELRDLTDDLPYASEPVDPPAGMKERILANVLKEEQPENDVQKIVEDTNENHDAKASPSGRGTKQRLSRWIPLLAAALLLSLIGNAYALMNGHSNGSGDSGKLSIAAAIKSVNLKSTGVMKNSEAYATLVKTDTGGVRVVLTAKDLKPLKGTEVYQVWLIDGKKPYRAGTFLPDQQGAGGVSYTMDLPNYHTWDKIAISVEPNSSSQTPKGQVVLAAGL